MTLIRTDLPDPFPGFLRALRHATEAMQAFTTALQTAPQPRRQLIHKGRKP